MKEALGSRRYQFVNYFSVYLSRKVIGSAMRMQGGPHSVSERVSKSLEAFAQANSGLMSLVGVVPGMPEGVSGGIESALNWFVGKSAKKGAKSKVHKEDKELIQFIRDDLLVRAREDETLLPELKTVLEEVGTHLCFIYDYHIEELKMVHGGIERFAKWCGKCAIHYIKGLKKAIRSGTCEPFDALDARAWIEAALLSDWNDSNRELLLNNGRSWSPSLFSKTGLCHQVLTKNEDNENEKRWKLAYKYFRAYGKGEHTGNKPFKEKFARFGYRHAFHNDAQLLEGHYAEFEENSNELREKHESTLSQTARVYYEQPSHIDIVDTRMAYDLLKDYLARKTEYGSFNDFLSHVFHDEKRPTVGVFHDMNFKAVINEGVNETKLDLSGANLSCCIFLNASFEEVCLEQVTFENAILIRGEFGGATLGWTSFKEAVLYHACFYGVEFTPERYRNADWTIVFEGAWLQFSDVDAVEWPAEVLLGARTKISDLITHGSDDSLKEEQVCDVSRQTTMKQVGINLDGLPLEVGSIVRGDNVNQTQMGDADVMIQSGLSGVPSKGSIKEIVFGSITQVQTRTQTKSDQQQPENPTDNVSPRSFT